MKTYTRGGAITLPLAASATTPLLPLITMPWIGYLLCFSYPFNELRSITILWYLDLHKNAIKLNLYDSTKYHKPISVWACLKKNTFLIFKHALHKHLYQYIWFHERSELRIHYLLDLYLQQCLRPYGAYHERTDNWASRAGFVDTCLSTQITKKLGTTIH